MTAFEILRRNTDLRMALVARMMQSGLCASGWNSRLHIVQKIMAAHAGTVEVAQANGRVTFRTVWPRTKDLASTGSQ